jgi:hypothetical protein
VTVAHDGTLAKTANTNEIKDITDVTGGNHQKGEMEETAGHDGALGGLTGPGGIEF